MRNEKGFTLIELLVVIVILGILAAVVVFAVSGLTDKGNTSACKIDTRTIRTAEEAYSSQQPTAKYDDTDALVTGKFLADKPTLHSVVDADINNTVLPPTYVIKITQAGADKGCGDVGDSPGQHVEDSTSPGVPDHTDY